MDTPLRKSVYIHVPKKKFPPLKKIFFKIKITLKLNSNNKMVKTSFETSLHDIKLNLLNSV